MKIQTQDATWAGTQASLDTYLQAMAALDAKMLTPQSPDDEEDDLPYLLSIRDGVGVIPIKGPLTNRDSPWLRYFGVTSYTAIREALVAAAQHPEVQQILLDVDSGGGTVAGVADTGALIRTIHTQVKPVTAFTDGAMMSAAYWLSSSAGKVYASKVAAVGSIGVISTHMEISKQLKDDGVAVTVMRAGKYKALANSYEPLSEEAKAQIQASLEGAYKVFVQHVAESRNVSYDLADTKMAQGREFFGEQAVSAGLADGLDTFDGIFSRLTRDAIDNRTHMAENRGQFRSAGMTGSSSEEVMPRAALTEHQIAAMAEAGLPITPAAEPAAAAAAEPAAAEPAAAAAESAAAEPAAAATPQAAGNDQLVSYLNAQVKERDAALVDTRVALATVTEKLAAAEAVTGDLTAIVARSVNNMQVSLGGSAVDLSAMSPVALITEHKRLASEFQTKFKAGGVAAVDAATAEKSGPVAQDSLTKARLAATSFSPK